MSVSLLEGVGMGLGRIDSSLPDGVNHDGTKLKTGNRKRQRKTQGFESFSAETLRLLIRSGQKT
jgi:hypothetical protein